MLSQRVFQHVSNWLHNDCLFRLFQLCITLLAYRTVWHRLGGLLFFSQTLWCLCLCLSQCGEKKQEKLVCFSHWEPKKVAPSFVKTTVIITIIWYCLYLLPVLRVSCLTKVSGPHIVQDTQSLIICYHPTMMLQFLPLKPKENTVLTDCSSTTFETAWLVSQAQERRDSYWI